MKKAIQDKLDKDALAKLMQKFVGKVDRDGYIIDPDGLAIPDDVKIIDARGRRNNHTPCNFSRESVYCKGEGKR